MQEQCILFVLIVPKRHSLDEIFVCWLFNPMFHFKLCFPFNFHQNVCVFRVIDVAVNQNTPYKAQFKHFCGLLFQC